MSVRCRAYDWNDHTRLSLLCAGHESNDGRCSKEPQAPRFIILVFKYHFQELDGGCKKNYGASRMLDDKRARREALRPFGKAI